MIVNYTSDNGWSTFLDNFKSQVPIITEEFENAKSVIESLGENQPKNWLKWAESMDYTDGVLLNFLSDVDSGKRSIDDIGNYLESAAKSTSTFSNITKTAGSALKTLGAFTLNMVATMAIEKVFEIGAKAIYDWINASEIAIQKGKEAKETIASIYDEYQNKSNIVNNSGQRFDELRMGVNQSTNENISLTNDQYSEYLSLCNEIAGIYPELVTSYDAQGNAILNLGSSAQSATEQLSEMLEVDQQIANLKIADNLQTAFNGTKEEVNQLQEQIDSLTQSAQEYQDIVDTLDSSSINSVYNQLDELAKGTRGSLDLNIADQDVFEKLKNSLYNAGLYVDQLNSSIFDSNGDGENDRLVINFDSLPDEKDIASAVQSVKDAFNTAAYDYSQNASQVRAENLFEISSLKKEQESLWNELLPQFESTLRTNPNYTQMTEDVQTGIMDALSKVDLSALPNDVNIEDYIKQTFLYPISGVFNDDAAKEIQDSINNLFSLDKSSLNVDEYEKQVDTLLSSLKDYYVKALGQTEGESKFNDFVTNFGFKVETSIADENGEPINGTDGYYNHLRDLMLDKAENYNQVDKINEMTVDELVRLNVQFEEDPSITIDDAINNVLSQNDTKVVSQLTFSSLLSSDADGSLTELVDNFQSDISSIQESLDSLKASEDVDLTDLVQQFPELAGETDNLQVALTKLSADKLQEFVSSYRNSISELTNPREFAKAESFLQNIINSFDFSTSDLSNYQSLVRSNLSKSGGTGSGASPFKTWEKLFNDFGDTVEGREILIKLSADPTNVYKSYDELYTIADNMELPIRLSINADTESTQSLLSQISAIKSALSSQSTGKSIDVETFNSEELKDYQSALEYVNGTMQINAEKAESIAKAKADEAIAEHEASKAQAQAKYLENAKEIDVLRESMASMDKSSQEYLDTASRISDLSLENDSIVSQCNQWDILNASIREATGTYQTWLDSQNAGDSGDMASDVRSAMSNINEVFDSSSEEYGRYYTPKYEAAVDFLVPEEVSSQGQDAVKKYTDNLSTYFTGDMEGAQKYVGEAIDKGLMEWSPDGKSVKIAAGKTMKDFADAFDWTDEVTQAMFGDLQTYFGQDAFSWIDESVKTIGDLGVMANEAAESLRGIEGNETLKINLDVSEFDTKEEKISALDSTIQEMNNLKAKPGVDTSEIDYANTVIQYCIAQKQQLEEPVVMSVDTSLVNGEVGNAISLLQQFQTAQNTLEMQASVGMDTTEAQANVDALVQQIQGINPKVSAELEIDTTSADSITASLATLTPEIMVKAGIDDSAIIGYTADDKEATVKYDVNKSAVDNYSPNDKNAKVIYTPDTSALPTELSPLRRAVQYYKTGDVGNNSLNGTANVSGTALVGGNWSARAHNKTGTTLIGEIAPEIVVHGDKGTWELRGVNGPEFYDLKPTDLVFNHLQSAALLERGHVFGKGSATIGGTAKVLGDNLNNSTFLSGVKGYKGSSSTSSSTAKTATKTAKSVEKAATKVKQSLDSIIESLSKLFDWIEVRVQRYEENIDLNKAKADNATNYQSKNAYISNAQTYTKKLIDVQEQAVAKYQKQADTVAKQVGLSASLKKKVDNGTINIQSLSEDNKKRVEQYKQWVDKAKSAAQAVEDLKQQQKELAQTKLDNIVEQYDAMLSHIEHSANLINEFVDQAELKGLADSTVYYDALIKNAESSISEMQKERTALLQSLQESVNSGIITVGSVEWYDMQSQINDVTESIQEANTNILEFRDNIRQITWDRFDKVQESIGRLTDESDFLIDLMGTDELFNDNGTITGQGMATFGLRGQNYNVLMEQANKYRDEMKRINAELANDKNNTKLIERRQELIDLQRESILAAEDEKQAIKDLVKNGIEKELDSLQELIDKYTNALDSQKDLNDYQKSVSDQTSEISNLRKQLYAYQNDTSEEGRLNTQSIRNKLKEAEDNLKETEYDKYISDQKDLLDELYSEYEEALNSRLDNIDELIANTIETINKNASDIGEILREESSSVGYTLTSEMDSIWGANGSATGILSTYSENFSNTMTTVQTTIKGIENYLSQLVAISNDQANKDVNTSTTSNSENPSVNGKTPTPSVVTTVNSNSSNSNTQSSDDEILKIIKSGNSNKAAIEKERKAKNHSALWTYIVDKYGHIPTYAIYEKLGKKLGVSAPKNYKVASETNALLKALRKKGYASGTPYVKKDEWAEVNEYGQEAITRPDGSIFIPLKKGSGVINNPNTEKLLSLADNYDNLMDMFNDYMLPYNTDVFDNTFKSELIKPITTENKNYNVQCDVTFDLPNVSNYEEFMEKMQHDSRFDGMITDMTIGRVNGKSNLSKYKYKF